LWNFYWRKYNKLVEDENKYRRFLTPIIFSILIIAYIIQNIFIFEALVTYVPLIMISNYPIEVKSKFVFTICGEGENESNLGFTFGVFIFNF
jgi:hypothetical protein